MDNRRTKIVATISDRRCDAEFIRSLHEAGVNVVRINSAHADMDGAARIVANVRSVSESIAILIDTISVKFGLSGGNPTLYDWHT